MTVIIVSTNRRDKAHDERLPYDCGVVAAVPVGGVREGEQGGGRKRVGKCLRLVLRRQLGRR